tara:strand:- start:191 stop:835 length:645 start_codon:yes stop_codon:yes gene_type:complete
MGALIMTHSDDKGLVLPPKLAPNQVVIVPIFKSEEQLEEISEVVEGIVNDLKSQGVSVKFDNRTTFRPGAKFAQHELQGVPLRIAIGPKDLENGTLELARRDTLTKSIVKLSEIVATVIDSLDQIQNELFQKALKYRDNHITEVNDFDEFKKILETKNGFISAHWDGSSETENNIKDMTKATIRCIPLDNKVENGRCVLTGRPSTQRVLFAKAY